MLRDLAATPSVEAVDRCIGRHLQLPWAFEMQASELRLSAIGRLASVHGTSAYDAAHLELAMHRACAIVSLDASLRAAARRERVEVLPARVAPRRQSESSATLASGTTPLRPPIRPPP